MWMYRVLAPSPCRAKELGTGSLALPQRGGWARLPCPNPSLSQPGISLIMWSALYTAEKVIIRWTLLTEACYFGVQFLGEA